MNANLTLSLDLTIQKDRKALRALLDVLDDAPPAGLDICSGETASFDPQRVTCWTSTDGAELVRTELNTSPNVDQVVTKTVPATEPSPAPSVKKEFEKQKKEVKKLENVREKAKTAAEDLAKAKDLPDARKIVETVIGVEPKVEATIGKGTELEGTPEEVADAIECEKIAHEDVVKIRKLQVRLAKYQALDEMKTAIRDITGIQKGKLTDIPAKFSEELISKLSGIADRIESEGK